MTTEPEPETPDVFREYLPHFALSPLPLDGANDDDESIRSEIERLSRHQMELQKELQAVINVVEIVQYDEKSEELQLQMANSFRSLGSASSLGSAGLTEDEIIKSSSNTTDTEEDVPAPRIGKMSFAAAFFKLAGGGEQKLSLEEQKEKQMTLVKENLAIMHPGLEDVLEIHGDMQDEIVEEVTRSMESLPRIADIFEKKQNSLEEEKQKQMDLLKEKLQEIDPELHQQIDDVRESQAEYVEQKRKEIQDSAQKKKLLEAKGRLTRTKSTRRFWNGAMSRLGEIVKKKRPSQAPISEEGEEGEEE